MIIQYFLALQVEGNRKGDLFPRLFHEIKYFVDEFEYNFFFCDYFKIEIQKKISLNEFAKNDKIEKKPHKNLEIN